MTIKDGDATAEATVTIENKTATEIIIDADTALTNAEAVNGNVPGSLAYIYYDVVDQYGESVRSSVNIQWSTSAGNATVDQTRGLITARYGTGAQPFMYGSDIVVVGVAAKEQITFNKTVKVGMAQKLDKVDMVGFLDTKGDKDTILTDLPANFAANRYLLLYRALDQNGHEMEEVANESTAVTFVVQSQTLLVDNASLAPGAKKTVKGVEYFTRTIEPAMYANVGGEFTLTAISGGTGSKTEKNFVVGQGAVLQSLELITPSLVCDGEGTDIEYVAKDQNGNTIKNFDTIVRSKNSITLTAAPGSLEINENEKGEAVIHWYDSSDFSKTDFARGKATMDGQDRPVTISVAVLGGDVSLPMTFYVKDARRPQDVFSVTAGNGVVEGSKLTYKLDDTKTKKSTIYFKDQYGKEVAEDVAYSFFNNASHGDQYAYRVALGFSSAALGSDIMLGAGSVDRSTSELAAVSAGGVGAAKQSVKYTAQIQKSKDNFANIETVGKALKDEIGLYKWSVVEAKDGALAIKDVELIRVETPVVGTSTNTFNAFKMANFEEVRNRMLSNDDAPVAITDEIACVTVDAISTKADRRKLSVVANFDGCSGMPVANKFFAVKTGTTTAAQLDCSTISDSDTITSIGAIVKTAEFTVSGTGVYLNKFIKADDNNNLKWSNFYSNSGKGERQNASLEIKVAVAKGDGTFANVSHTVSVKVPVCDAEAAASTVKVKSSADGIVTVDGDKITLRAEDMTFNLNKLEENYEMYNQYGLAMTNRGLNYNVMDLKESKEAFNHCEDKIECEKNCTGATVIKNAEVGDTFTLCVPDSWWQTQTAVYKVTFAGDVNASMTNTDDNDKTFRKNCLKFAN